MKTITFYSYKGGVGRSLLVANLAKFLARFGQKVVVWDFDLEAPGLHFKFGLRERGVEIKAGIVDYIHSYLENNAHPEVLDGHYLYTVNLNSRCSGSILLMPAGDAPSVDYASKLASIRWHDLFYTISKEDQKKKLNVPTGIRLFEELKERVGQELGADYLLIDSRTGMTDVGGLALNVLPDQVIFLLLKNLENQVGIREILKSIQLQIKNQRRSEFSGAIVLTHIPEIATQEELQNVNEVKQFFSEALEEPSIREVIENLVTFHIHSDLQLNEKILFDEDITPNEALLLRDYYRLFQTIGCDMFLEEDIRKFFMGLASKQKLEPIDQMKDRLRRGHKWQFRTEKRLVRDRIIERGKGGVAYLLPLYHSKVMGFPKLDDLANCMIKHFRSHFHRYGGATQKKMTRQSWDHLVSIRMQEGDFDFCAEPIFMTPSRSYLLGLVQFGWLKTFTGLIREERSSEIVALIGKINDGLAAADRHNLGEIFRNIAIDERFKIQVGIIGETAAASEAIRFLSSILKPNDLRTWNSERELKDWMEGKKLDDDDDDEGKHRIAICDHIVARSLVGNGGFMSSRENRELLFNFSPPVPVGFPYPSNDTDWRREIVRVFTEALVDPQMEAQWHTNFSKELEEGAFIEVLSPRDLIDCLLLDMEREEAMEWRSKLRRKLII